MIGSSEKWTLYFVVLLVACEHPDGRPNVASIGPADASSAAAQPIDASPHGGDAAADTSVRLADAPDAAGSTVHAWFSLTPPKKCPEGLPDIGACYGVTLRLHGGVERELVVKKNQWGQEYCRTDGKTVSCGGASGGDSIALRCAPSGGCVVESVEESDGYCPPPQDCRSRTRLVTFTVPSDATLVYSKD